MEKTCTTIATTRCLSLGNVARWMSNHRSYIIKQCEETTPAPLPTPKWWGLIAAVMFSSDRLPLQWRDTIIPGQNEQFSSIED